jgi:RNA methyltransferase, TrmH family
VETITSTRNPRVREVAALHRRRERRERGQHLVEGVRTVAAAYAAGVVEEVWATEETAERLDLPAGAPLVIVAEHVLERVADARTPQGVVAIARTSPAALASVVGRGLLVVLDAVSDPGNVGTIVRTADAAGAVGVVLTEGSADVYAPKTVRAAAGSTYHLPVVTEVTLVEVVRACHAAGQQVFGLDGHGERSVDDLAGWSSPPALVLGNEAHGLAPDTVGLLEGRAAIQLRGRAESLNVAAAAAIAIYAAARGVVDRQSPQMDLAGEEGQGTSARPGPAGDAGSASEQGPVPGTH